MSNIINRPPYIKGKGYLVNPVVVKGVPKEADSRLNPNVIGTVAWEQYWMEQLYYIHNGYQTGGLWVPGRYYYYMNYTVMNDIEIGAFNPDNTDLHLEYAYLIDYCKKNGGNLMAPKARRRGLSEASHSMVVDYDYRFSEEKRQLGVAAGHSVPIDDFITKWKYAETQLPPELFIGKTKVNQKEVIAGWQQKNELNSWESKGTFNTIYLRTMGVDPNMFKGLFLHSVVFEELGEFDGFLECWDATKDCLMSGQKQIGSAFAYGCVCAGTKVWDNYGNLVNIEDLIPENGIIGFDKKTNLFSKENITYWQPPAEKMCYKIITNTGRYLECSEDHPILYSHKDLNRGPKKQKKKHIEFKETRFLNVGDQVAIIDGVEVFGIEKMWEPRLVGWLIGDGSYGIDHSPRLSTCDNEISDFVLKNFDSKTVKSHLTKDGKLYEEIRIKGICGNLRILGIYGQTKNKKRLPLNHHSYIKNDIYELIGGFFDTDGHVNEFGIPRITLTASGFDLLHEVRLLLQKIGIHCNINKIKCSIASSPKSRNDYYRIEISKRESILRFHDKISFVIKYKQLKLNRIANLLSKSVVKQVRGVEGLVFERIVGIECIGIKHIYNLTAGNTNTYIANGIVTHNTGGRIDKGSKDFKAAWERDAEKDFCKTHNFIRWVPDGRRMYYFGGATLEQKRLPVNSKLREKYKDYQLIGVDDTELAEEDILRRRKEFLESGDVEAYNKFVQNNPINEREIFRKTNVNNFNHNIINSQLDKIRNMSHVPYTKYRMEYIKDTKTGLPKQPAEIEIIPIKPEDNQSVCCVILDDGHPIKNFSNRYCAGIDSYNVDESSNSKSLGGMLVLDRKTKIPVAFIRCRPKTKEIFYELCLKLSIYYKLHLNVLGDIASDGIIQHFDTAGYYNMIAYRPKKFEALTSEQKHPKWVRLTTHSKPLMIGLMQFHINHHCDNIMFPELLDEVGDYDEIAKESDNDLADAYGIALMQDIANEVAARDNEDNQVSDRFELPKFKDGRMIKESGVLKNIQQDSALFGMMFGKQE